MSKIADIVRSFLPNRRQESDEDIMEEFDDVDKDFVESLQLDKEDEEVLGDTAKSFEPLSESESKSMSQLDEVSNLDDDGGKKKDGRLKRIFSKVSLPRFSAPKLKKSNNNRGIVEKKASKKSPKPRKSEAVKGKAIVIVKIVLLFLMVGAFGFVSYKMFFDNSGSTTQSPQANKDENLSDSSDYVLNQDILAVNPFVQIGALPAMAGNQQTTNNVMPSPLMGARALPAIPNTSAPVQASVPPVYRDATVTTLPPIPSNAPSPAIPNMPAGSNNFGSSSATVTVQGVFTGNDGNNMAILSDGSVVSEGESYQDGRIAYIGGDGIKFDDGKTMNYGER